MIYELRSYDIEPTLLDLYLQSVNDRVLPLLVNTFNFRLIGFWHAVPTSTDPAPSTNVHWIIAWESEQEMLDRWAEAKATEEWAAAWQGLPKFHLKIQRTMLQAIPFSPLQ
jgi:ABC-type oligopeptide transport system substrate-binding subunit